VYILGWISSEAGRDGAIKGDGVDVVHEGEAAIVANVDKWLAGRD
jgi:hypothetical protein